MNKILRTATTDRRDNSEDDVVVIGGGLAGLTAAATIAAAGRRVVVREKLGVLGGDARSVTRDGFTFNHGPHALYRGGPAEQILTELGVKISGGAPPIKGRLVMNGVAHIAPAGLPTLLKTRAFPPAAKFEIAKVLAVLSKLRAEDHRHLSASQWIDDLVRHDHAVDYLRAVIRLTTYSNQPDSLSADAAILQLQAALDTGVLYLDGGWQTLVDQLAATPAISIEVGEAVTELPDAPAVIIAGGGPTLASTLLSTTFEVGPKAQLSVIDFGLRRRPDHDVVIGGDVPFYFSNHSAVAKLAPAGCYHAVAGQYLAEGDPPDHRATESFTTHGGVREDDIMTSRRLHLLTAATALPTADLGGLPGRPKATDTGHDNVFIAGDWVGPVGLLADASVASGKAAALAALAQLRNRTMA